MKEREAQREGVRGEDDAGGNNLESSFSTLTAKVASTERQIKYSWWTQNVTRSRALHGATGVKNGVKSGGFGGHCPKM
jgi:hypothetical protein